MNRKLNFLDYQKIDPAAQSSNDISFTSQWEKEKPEVLKCCATCKSLLSCNIDVAYMIPEWDGTKDYCSRFE